MSRTGIGVVIGAEPVEIFAPEDGGCTAFQIHCHDTSATWVEVQIKGLHGTEDWAAVRQGRDLVFRLRHGSSGGIHSVMAQGGGGEATIDYAVVADTDRHDER